MEGTVTISLKDYEELKKSFEDGLQWASLAEYYLRLLERIEEVLVIENIENELIAEVKEAINNWYE